MSITTSTSPGISQRTNTYAAVKMLMVAGPTLVLEKTGPLIKPMPKNKGVNVKFRRPVPFEASTIPLQEGVTPSATSFRYEDISGSLDQYGMVVQVTDVIMDTHEDPVLNDVVQQLGENIGRTQEALNYAVLRGGTNVFYQNGTQRTDVNTPISLNKQRAVTRFLEAQKGMPITNVLDGSPDYGTMPIQGGYIAVGHTNLDHDIRSMPGFVPVAQYGNRKPICPQEIGAVDSVRYLLSPDLSSIPDAGGAKGSMVSTSGTSADVYPILYFAKEAWGLVPLRGEGSVEPSIVPPSKTIADPLAQRGAAGYKFWHLALILNEFWMGRLEVAATDL